MLRCLFDALVLLWTKKCVTNVAVLRKSVVMFLDASVLPRVCVHVAKCDQNLCRVAVLPKLCYCCVANDVCCNVA